MTIAYKSNSRLGRRRSQRVTLTVPIVVSEPEASSQNPLERTKTLSVSQHGGLITMRASVNCGQNLLVTNPSSRVSQECRVVYVSPEEKDARRVGFEFLGPVTNFWNISFPVTA
jgi:PilZ domain